MQIQEASIDSSPITIAPANQFRASVAEWLYIEDWQAVDIVAATVASLYLPGDPVWTLLVGASGAGKTELLSCFAESKDTYLLSNLTPHTLLSGLQGKAQDTDLLYQLDGKLLLMKDSSPLFSMANDDMAEIMAQLRDAYDGHVVRAWGSGKETARWRGKFGLLAASTRSLERQWKFTADLGERFLRVDFQVNPYELTAAALEMSGQESEARKALSNAGTRFTEACSVLAAEHTKHIPPDFAACVLDLANITATLRTAVPRDHLHNPMYLPEPEVGSRLGKQLLRLGEASAFAHQRMPADDDYDLLLRVSSDSIPSRRRAVLGSILGGAIGSKAINLDTNIPPSTIREDLDDLRLLGVLDADGKIKVDAARLFGDSGLDEELTR